MLAVAGCLPPNRLSLKLDKQPQYWPVQSYVPFKLVVYADHALIDRRKRDFYGDAMFGESSYLMMYGKIIWPEDQNFSKAQIFLNSKAEFDDHWKGEDGKEE